VQLVRTMVTDGDVFPGLEDVIGQSEAGFIVVIICGVIIKGFEGTVRLCRDRGSDRCRECGVTLERPLLVKGEPGTGKTELARQVATSLGLPIIEWHIKSTTARSRGFTNTTPSAGCATASWARSASMTCRQLHQARQALAGLRGDGKCVLLIDEIDKADIEFPNDLLQELDRMEFFVYETGRP
jgi:hypothetical protein